MITTINGWTIVEGRHGNKMCLDVSAPEWPDYDEHEFRLVALSLYAAIAQISKKRENKDDQDSFAEEKIKAREYYKDMEDAEYEDDWSMSNLMGG